MQHRIASNGDVLADEGITIDAQTWAELVAAGAKVGVHIAP